ncbi:hypothetical protein ACEPPN_000728 [Leptodophora sp. 'Broadleaf-Isolate-01']
MAWLQQICQSDDADLCKQILAITSTVYRPTTLLEITTFIQTLDDIANDHESLVLIIALCGSFLTLREGTISFVHQSAKDFMLNGSSNEIFPSGPESSGLTVDQVKQLGPDPLAAVKYSFLYWVDHLFESQVRKDTMQDLSYSGSVDDFLSQYLLYWLEAPSLMRSLSSGIVMIRKLEVWLQSLLLTRALFEGSSRSVFPVGSKVSPKWNHIRARHYRHSRAILTNKTLRLWNTATGSLLQTVEGHSDEVSSVGFSPDSKQVVSSSWDKTLRLWDAATGAPRQMLEGYYGAIVSVELSPDGRLQILRASDG